MLPEPVRTDPAWMTQGIMTGVCFSGVEVIFKVKLSVCDLMVLECFLFRMIAERHLVDHLPGIMSVSRKTASCWKIWSEAWLDP